MLRPDAAAAVVVKDESLPKMDNSLGGRFGYFLFFFCSGRGKGESEAPERGGGSVFIGGGGGFPGGGGDFRRVVWSELGNLGGGGRKYFFLTCFHASFFPFCLFCWPPLFLPFSGHLFGLFSPSKSASLL